MRIDLDAAAAARREANGEAPVVVFAGNEYTLPVEVPFEASRRLAAEAEDDYVKAAFDFIGALMGAEAFERFMAAGPSTDDVKELMRGLSKSYGFGGGLPESEASPDS